MEVDTGVDTVEWVTDRFSILVAMEVDMAVEWVTDRFSILVAMEVDTGVDTVVERRVVDMVVERVREAERAKVVEDMEEDSSVAERAKAEKAKMMVPISSQSLYPSLNQLPSPSTFPSTNLTQSLTQFPFTSTSKSPMR